MIRATDSEQMDKLHQSLINLSDDKNEKVYHRASETIVSKYEKHKDLFDENMGQVVQAHV